MTSAASLATPRRHSGTRRHPPRHIQELDDIHRALDAAVLRAYGWPEDLSDEAILERLLGLNLERAEESNQGSGSGSIKTGFLEDG